MKTKAHPPARSGRFAGKPDEAMAAFSESVSFDWRLWRHDIVGSMAHAAMLHRVGILTRRELLDVLGGLERIGGEIASGKFKWRPEFEDVHMNIEAELTRRVPAGAKLHTARSRNDQVALDMRLWLREETAMLDVELRTLQRALVGLAERHSSVIMPGYTHLQRAQPVPLAHHLLAYVEMFDRDRDRLRSGFERLNVCPLGSGALAGTTLPIDRGFVARKLGFVDNRGRPRLTRNSIDAVADRDFVVEFVGAAALVGVHLSRLAEDLVLWASAEFDFVSLPDAYTTGSSLMPQKRNPDAPELVRGKTGRLIGNLVSLLTLLKGLPMAYNRDLQEDKERMFDAADTVRDCVCIMAGMIEHTNVKEDVCARAAADPGLLATDLAEYLVKKGVPFRQAHHVVGAAVAAAEKLGKPLSRLTPVKWRHLSPLFGPDVVNVFKLSSAVRRRKTPGGAGLAQIRGELKRWRLVLEEMI